MKKQLQIYYFENNLDQCIDNERNTHYSYYNANDPCDNIVSLSTKYSETIPYILSDRVSTLLIQELPVTIAPSKPHKIETEENSDDDMWSDKNWKIQYAKILADRAEQERTRNLTPQQKKDMVKNAKRDAYNQANGIVAETVVVADVKKKR